jgi:hypothetical protein
LTGRVTGPLDGCVSGECGMNAKAGFRFVQSHGNILERARLEAVVWGQAPDQAVVDRLARMQDSDGGFKYWVPDVSNICDTAYVLQWLDDLGLHGHPVSQAACQFLLDRQREDGGWDEVAAVKEHGAPEWMMPGRIATRVWLTAFCAHVLVRFGCAEAQGTACPTNFLLAHVDELGRLEGYFRATWIALPMLAFYPGPESEPFLRAVALVEREYSPEWDGAYLGWLLRCLCDAGLPRQHSLVDLSLRDLGLKQRSDGSWDPEEGEGEGERVNSTITAFRALAKYGELGGLEGVGAGSAPLGCI